jgi:hypothetical protein
MKLFVFSMLLGLLGGCTFNTGQDDTLVFSFPEGQSDTLSPRPEISIVFSDRLTDDTVQFMLEPFFDQFHSILNPSRDTVRIIVTSLLPGKSRYALYLTGKIESINGATAAPGRDSLVFYTHATEQEPNNTMDAADTFGTVLFGIAATVDDVDWIVFDTLRNEAMYLQCEGGSAAFSFYSGSGESAGPRIEVATCDTAIFPSSLSAPLFVKIESHSRSTGVLWKAGYAAGLNRTGAVVR